MTIDKTTVNKITGSLQNAKYQNAAALKLAVFKNLDDIVQSSTYVESGKGTSKTGDKKTVRHDYFETAVTLGGETYTVRLDVAVKKGSADDRTETTLSRFRVKMVIGGRPIIIDWRRDMAYQKTATSAQKTAPIGFADPGLLQDQQDYEKRLRRSVIDPGLLQAQRIEEEKRERERQEQLQTRQARKEQLAREKLMSSPYLTVENGALAVTKPETASNAFSMPYVGTQKTAQDLSLFPVVDPADMIPDTSSPPAAQPTMEEKLAKLLSYADQPTDSDEPIDWQARYDDLNRAIEYLTLNRGHANATGYIPDYTQQLQTLMSIRDQIRESILPLADMDGEGYNGKYDPAFEPMVNSLVKETKQGEEVLAISRYVDEAADLSDSGLMKLEDLIENDWYNPTEHNILGNTPKSSINIKMFTEGAEKIRSWVEKVQAYNSLYSTAKGQYGWQFAAADVLSPIISSYRINTSIEKVDKNKSLISKAATTFGVPEEIIGGIIFKEQLTKTLPDNLANFDTFFDGTILGIIPKSYHSTGLGAIGPSTAREAWEFIDPSMVNSLSDKHLQYMLTYSNEFNIQTIAAVLVDKAKIAKLIDDPSEAQNLTQEQWKKAVALYNGSDEYARKVYEYLSDIKKLLN